MEAFVSRKRRRLSSSIDSPPDKLAPDKLAPAEVPPTLPSADEDSTELKLALLASLRPFVDQDILLDALLASHGSVEDASRALRAHAPSSVTTPRPAPASNSYQSSLSAFAPLAPAGPRPKIKPLTKKGRTLHLYSPEDIAAHTPCSIIHNFLPADEANDLLRELLGEVPTFTSATFRLFENVVTSPHTACFFVRDLDEAKRQQTEYLYNGGYLTDIRQITPQMGRVSPRVQAAVNREIRLRIQTHYPGAQKLQYQSPHEWIPNAAFVNCYAGAAQSVGYHSDQLTYLGPRAVIGSLSLGVSREFRVRRVVPRDEPVAAGASSAAGPEEEEEGHVPNEAGHAARADLEGQISIHLPHNSLLVMHAEMQEEWKHSIAPAAAIDPHPIAGNRRINITYRYYRDSFHPRRTPRCQCRLATVLRCVQRKKENRGRYFWMCHAGLQPGKDGCTFFQWADFDDDGEPQGLQTGPLEKVAAGNARKSREMEHEHANVTRTVN
ncbi:MAG: hypothetical protein M1826_000491 [Phylliscum demangeonii]|nr:MAG: hypothetical protein M1826_000491 [Phylliscum demangeonii]